MSAVLPISSDTRYRVYESSGSQTLFAVPFPWQDNADIRVSIVVDDAETILDPADYTLFGVGNPAGGSVTLNEAPPAGAKVVVAGAAVMDRVLSIVRGGKYTSEATDADLDRALIRDQELRRDIDRSIKLPLHAADRVDTILPAPGGGQLIGYDADGVRLIATETPSNEKTLREQADMALAALIGAASGSLECRVMESQTELSLATVEEAIQAVWTMGRGAAGDRGAGMMIRISLATATSLGIHTSALVRSQDRYLPGMGGTHSTNGGYWVKSGPVITPQQFGTNFAAAQNAVNHAAKMGLQCRFFSDVLYSGAQFTVPANSIWLGDARFSFDGSLGDGGPPSISFGNNFKGQTVRLHTPGGASIDKNQLIGDAGTGFDCALLHMTAANQRQRGGFRTAENCRFGKIIADKIDRPLQTQAATYSDSTYCIVEDMDITSYVRGLNAIRVGYFGLFGGVIRTKSPNGSKTNGHNAILLDAVGKVFVADHVDFGDSPEHTIRVGGGSTIEAPYTKEVYLGEIVVRRAGGCAVKMNQGTNLLHHFHCAGLTAEDCSQGGEGNQELFRLTRVASVHVGYIRPRRSSTSMQWPRQAMVLNNVQNLTVESIEGEYRSAIVEFDGDSDASPSEPDRHSGPCTNMSITFNKAKTTAGTLVKFAASSNVTGKPKMTLGDLRFHLNGAEWGTSGICNFTYDGDGSFTPIQVTAPIIFTGWVGGDSVPALGVSGTGNTTDPDAVLIDLVWQNRSWSGSANRLRSAPDVDRQVLASAGTAFDPSNVPPMGALMINQQLIPAGQGNMGAGIGWTRFGSGRRGLWVVPVQTGADGQNMGLAFYVGGSPSTSSDSLSLGALIDHRGRLSAQGGLQLNPLSSAPSSPQQWGIYVSNGSWGAGAGLNVWNGTAWKLLNLT